MWWNRIYLKHLLHISHARTPSFFPRISLPFKDLSFWKACPAHPEASLENQWARRVPTIVISNCVTGRGQPGSSISLSAEWGHQSLPTPGHARVKGESLALLRTPGTQTAITEGLCTSKWPALRHSPDTTLEFPVQPLSSCHSWTYKDSLLLARSLKFCLISDSP